MAEVVAGGSGTQHSRVAEASKDNVDATIVSGIGDGRPDANISRRRLNYFLRGFGS